MMAIRVSFMKMNFMMSERGLRRMHDIQRAKQVRESETSSLV